MSTAAQVRAKWNTLLLQHATVQAYTTKTYTYQVAVDSLSQEAKLLFGQKINFITCIATRSESPEGATNSRNYIHRVVLTYTLEADTTGANHAAIIDRMDTMHDLVDSQLDTTWDGVLNGFYRPLEIAVEPALTEIAGRQVFQMSNIYEGIDRVSV